ncbi:MAG: Hsp20/alpha crystallin family protein [Verrucomicrobiales bacterium]|nr:Hsp20/alpha crystallin family protein [Verrucomicrobiales bacterium]
MKMIRYSNPTTDFNDWDSFFADPFRAFAPLLAGRSTSAYRPADAGVEWYEDDENFYVRVELPGVPKSELHLDAEDGLVRISYEKEVTTDGSARRESFERHLRTPEGTDVAAIGAKLEDGILELSLPKAPERKPVSITVS